MVWFLYYKIIGPGNCYWLGKMTQYACLPLFILFISLPPLSFSLSLSSALKKWGVRAGSEIEYGKGAVYS